MIADQNVMTFFALFYPTASATAYGQRPKFFRAEHSATAEGENCAYGPTLEFYGLKYYTIFWMESCYIFTFKNMIITLLSKKWFALITSKYFFE